MAEYIECVCGEESVGGAATSFSVRRVGSPGYDVDPIDRRSSRLTVGPLLGGLRLVNSPPPTQVALLHPVTPVPAPRRFRELSTVHFFSPPLSSLSFPRVCRHSRVLPEIKFTRDRSIRDLTNSAEICSRTRANARASSAAASRGKFMGSYLYRGTMMHEMGRSVGRALIRYVAVIRL